MQTIQMFPSRIKADWQIGRVGRSQVILVIKADICKVSAGENIEEMLKVAVDCYGQL